MRGQNVKAPPGQRHCTICLQFKPVAEFAMCGANSRPGSYCKPCKAEYERNKRRAKAGVITEKDIARFWSRVDKRGPVFEDRGPCWAWQGAPRNHEGYGQFHIGGRNLTPHTVMFMLRDGIQGSREIFVDHECRNRMCLNPDHLRFVTPKQNALENNDSPFAVNAKKTHCPHGHPLSGENVAYLRLKNPRGTSYTTSRQCLTCYPNVRNSKDRIYPEEAR